MRLLVVVNHFSPDRGGGGAVYTDMCFALAERGVDVTVYCPYPFYPEWKDKSRRNGLRFWRYFESGVRVVRYGLYIPRDPRSLWQRLLFEASLFLSLLRLMPSIRKFDAVMVFCPYFGMVAAVGLAKLIYRKPVWLNVQDIAVGAARATGIVRSGVLVRAFAATERFFYNFGDVWSSISPVMITALEPMRRRDQPLMFLPNWADKSLLGRLAARGSASLGRAREPVQLLYAGNIGRKQNLLEFCQHLHGSDCPFRFKIFGAGGAAAELKEWLDGVRDARFSFGSFLDADELARELTEADLYVITERPDTGDSFFPSKLVTGMAAGTPILAICDSSSPLGREMHDAAPGPSFEWSELDRVPELLSRLAHGATALDAWRENARARATHYDRDRIVDELKENLERLVEGLPVQVSSGRVDDLSPAA